MFGKTWGINRKPSFRWNLNYSPNVPSPKHQADLWYCRLVGVPILPHNSRAKLFAVRTGSSFIPKQSTLLEPKHLQWYISKAHMMYWMPDTLHRTNLTDIGDEPLGLCWENINLLWEKLMERKKDYSLPTNHCLRINRQPTFSISETEDARIYSIVICSNSTQKCLTC